MEIKIPTVAKVTIGPRDFFNFFISVCKAPAKRRNPNMKSRRKSEKSSRISNSLKNSSTRETDDANMILSDTRSERTITPIVEGSLRKRIFRNAKKPDNAMIMEMSCNVSMLPINLLSSF